MNPRYALNLSVIGACLEADIPVFLWGPPGSGKSSAVRRLAADRGYRLTEITPSILDPTDLLGLPYLVGEATRYALPDWLADIAGSGEERHLIFLDDLNLAPVAVMNACLRLVLERAAHTTQLPPGVRFAAAGTDPSQVPAARFLSPAMANRFAHVEWTGLGGSEWLTAKLQDWPTPAPVAVSDKDWRMAIAAFHTVRPQIADAFADGKAAGEGRGYASARSWDALCRVLPYAGRNPDMERALADAIIGKAASREFIAHVRTDLTDGNIP